MSSRVQARRGARRRVAGRLRTARLCIEPPRIEPPRIEPPRIEPPRIEPPQIEPPRDERRRPQWPAQSQRRVVTGLLLLVLTSCAGLRSTTAPTDPTRHTAPAAPDLRAFRMAPPTGVRPLSVRFRLPLLASKLAVLEACVRAGAERDHPACGPLRSRVDATGRARLQAFAAARARFLRARVAPGQPVSPPWPLRAALLPPAELQAAEAFAEPFFRFATLAEALEDLSLPPTDTAAVRAAFVWFAAPLASLTRALAARRPHLALAGAARVGGFDRYLALLARFYGVGARLPRRLSVDVVWAPAGPARATAWSGRAVVPFTPALFGHPGPTGTFPRAALVRVLGVVVHEFGHVFASLLPYRRRRELTHRIAGEVGVLHRRHANVLDEAVQTAAGNVLYLRAQPTWTDLSRELYAAEPGQRFPRAIDTLSRHLAPVLARYLATPAAFDGPFLDAALQTHAAVFGRPPYAFAAACVVVSNAPPVTARWRAAFPGLRRRAVDPGADRAATGLTQNPWLSRWHLRDLSRPAAAGAAWPTSAAQTAALRCARRRDVAACFAARRRGDAAGWDLALVGRDVAALARLVDTLRSATTLADRVVRDPLSTQR